MTELTFPSAPKHATLNDQGSPITPKIDLWVNPDGQTGEHKIPKKTTDVSSVLVYANSNGLLVYFDDHAFQLTGPAVPALTDAVRNLTTNIK